MLCGVCPHAIISRRNKRFSFARRFLNDTRRLPPFVVRIELPVRPATNGGADTGLAVALLWWSDPAGHVVVLSNCVRIGSNASAKPATAFRVGARKTSRLAAPGVSARAHVPAVSSMGRVLQRLHLSHPRPRRPRGPVRTWPPFRTARRPNEVWTVDFKGCFRTADGLRCEPLTVRDLYSRYGLCVCILPDRSEQRVRCRFERLFRRYGLPHTIHCDKGGPFGTPAGASLAVERVVDQSGHWSGIQPAGTPRRQWRARTMASRTQSGNRPPARSTPAAQQARTTRWLRHYNEVRPHEALRQPCQPDTSAESPSVSGASSRWSSRHWLFAGCTARRNLLARRRRFVGEASGGYRGVAAQTPRRLAGLLLSALPGRTP